MSGTNTVRLNVCVSLGHPLFPVVAVNVYTFAAVGVPEMVTLVVPFPVTVTPAAVPVTVIAEGELN
jgi:hypothetical protein